MSLILQALKRAERERKAQNSPDSGTIFRDKTASRRRRNPLFWICGALLVNAIVLALLFRPGASTQAPAPSDPKAAIEKASTTSSTSAGPARPLFLEARVAQAPPPDEARPEPPTADNPANDPLWEAATNEGADTPAAFTQHKPEPAAVDHRPANAPLWQVATNYNTDTSNAFARLKHEPDKVYYRQANVSLWQASTDNDTDTSGGGFTQHEQRPATVYHAPASVPSGPAATNYDTDTPKDLDQFKFEPTGSQELPAGDLPASTSTYIPPSLATPSAITTTSNPIWQGKPEPKDRHQPRYAPETAVADPQAKELLKPIPTVNKLPFERQNELQDLKINIHVFSKKPEKCFVYINMQRYYAGDLIRENGALLEKITPDGVIINHRNKRTLLQTGRP
ncbi:MAG: GspB domain-containing protein [bacterium]|nr:GspB domain-containing protein [bacterium]